MTVLENTIRIDAPRERVWAVLSALDALERYDPGIRRSEIVSEERRGPGAARRCDLAPGGWFKERVVEWRPSESLSFELFDCTLPVRHLRHSYAIESDGATTLVRQRMEYQLKFGPLGRLMDALMVRGKWDAGIKSFLAGLKRYVEEGRDQPPAELSR
jgi:ligand-binding SRPBCC domain-containing protein